MYEYKTVEGCKNRVICIERSVISYREALINRDDLTATQRSNFRELIEFKETVEMSDLERRIEQLDKLLHTAHINALEEYKGFM